MWEHIYRHVYLRTDAPFSEKYHHIGKYINEHQSKTDSPDRIYRNRLVLLNKNAHLTGVSYTDEQVAYLKDYLAFITVRGMSPDSRSAHEMESLCNRAFQILADNQDNNPTDIIATISPQAKKGKNATKYTTWTRFVKTLNATFLARARNPGADGRAFAAIGRYYNKRNKASTDKDRYKNDTNDKDKDRYKNDNDDKNKDVKTKENDKPFDARAPHQRKRYGF
jgi:hypothetical protein